MSFELKGSLTDSNGKPLSNHIIKAFDKDPLIDLLGDDPLGSSVTLDDGSFKITFSKEDFKKPAEFWESVMNEPELYLKIFDVDGTIMIHETGIISDPFSPYVDPTEVNQYEAVVIGSGFGGTIVSLSLVNKFVKDAANNPGSEKKKVILLERGQWWVSHELPSSPGSHEFERIDQQSKGIREFLETNDRPYRTWPYPDNLNGLSQFLNTVRVIDRRGLYDYRISSKVHTLAASGVGGGSLVYTNVTEKPHDTVLDSWDSNLNLGINASNLSSYFDMARGFIGVNKIVTTTSIGDIKLQKSKVFQEAAEKIRQQSPAIVTNKSTFDTDDPGQDPTKYEEDIYAVDLSITDIPYRKDENTIFKKSPLLVDGAGNYSFSTILNAIQGNQPTNQFLREKLAYLLRKFFPETNVCQRQGRCALGCIPGARHTNNKKIFDYLRDSKKKEHFDVYALCEVYDIEPLLLPGGSFKYRVYYNDYGARDWKQANFNWDNGPNSYKLKIRLFRLVDGGKKKTIECKQLILAAGAIGSTEILLKSINTTRQTGEKLVLSSRLGKGYSTNGDLLGVINPTKTDIYATRGPIVTSAIKFNEGSGFVYTIEDSNIPKMFAGVSRLLSQSSSFRRLLGNVGSGRIQEIISMITHPSGIPLSNFDFSLQISEQDLSKTLLLAGMGTDTSDGIIKLQDAWKNNPNRDMNAWNVLDINFDMNKLLPLFNKMRHSMEIIAKKIGEKGSTSFSTPLWNPTNTNENLTIVLHNLGGCSIGKDRNNGVVNNFGQVYKGDGLPLTETYNDFYIVDGGIVPSSIGVNSSLTISALAFRIAENIVGHSNLPIEEITIGTKTFYFSQ